MIEVIEPLPAGLGLGQPVEFLVVGRSLIILVDKVDQRTTDALDGRHVHGFLFTFVRLATFGNCVIESLLSIDHTPAHRRGAGPIFGDEFSGKAARFRVQDVGDIALLPKFNIFALVPCGQREPHASKQVTQFLRILMGEFDKFEPVGPGGVFVTDL